MHHPPIPHHFLTQTSKPTKPEPQKSTNHANNLLTLHTANRWMQIESTTPDPDMLFGNFWHQHELSILFADTNLGKSILAVQLGHEISRGACIEPFANNTRPASVLYLDFELTAKQFQQRYRESHATHNFAENFYRAEFNTGAQMPPQFKNFNNYMHNAIESAITSAAAQVLIIDNISCLNAGTNESTNQALNLMKHLKTLKNKHQLSILVLAHTPKRNPANPISRNDLQGSRMLMNFADSAFAMGQSNADPSLRYLKQVKQRNGREIYGPDNICLFQLQKQFGYLHFKFTGYAHEQQHLRRYTQTQRDQQKTRIIQLRADGHTQRHIAAKLGIAPSTVNKLLNADRFLKIPMLPY
jgi:RecA-family ATPase